ARAPEVDALPARLRVPLRERAQRHAGSRDEVAADVDGLARAAAVVPHGERADRAAGVSALGTERTGEVPREAAALRVRGSGRGEDEGEREKTRVHGRSPFECGKDSGEFCGHHGTQFTATPFVQFAVAGVQKFAGSR